MEKVWFDTDIGSDIDDAVALAYLLTKPECELLGVSTVSGQPVERAKIADVLCRAAGKNIPIYPGIERPILRNQCQPEAGQAKKLGNWEHSNQFETGKAIEAMYEAITRNPGEVTLLAVGPMTNVALLLKVHPDVSSLLKSIVLMCGEFLGKVHFRCEAEWNALCDPHATAVIFGTEGMPIRSIGLDVTTKVTMNSAMVKEKFTTPVLRAVYDFAQVWFEGGDTITFHDPLAAVSIFKPEVMTYEKGKVSVELLGSRVAGRTYFDRDENGTVEVGSTVDADAFFAEYFAHQC